MKKAVIIILIIVVLGALGFILFSQTSTDVVRQGGEETAEEPIDSENEEGETTEMEQTAGPKLVIGKSAGGRDIEVYSYGGGQNHILFVGGIHGGYSWNTALVAYNLIDYLENNPLSVPQNVKVSVIPVMNPDGLYKVTGTTGRFSEANVSQLEAERVSGRFNGNNVDLNRNFDCDWQSEAVWQNKNVSGGSAAFSEPESMSVKNYIETNSPDAVVVWYSSAGGVFVSNCHEGVLAETREITNVYAEASGYPAHEEFNYYEITGDMTNWLSKIGVPATSILLSTHEDVEWEKNLKGIKAVIDHYAI